VRTNRELYKAIETLLEEKKESLTLTLEAYLRNLRKQVSQFSSNSTITLEQFFSLLKNSFDETALVIEETDPNPNFQTLACTIDDQIQDLAEMAANGQLENDHKHLEINAPSGRQWYNFDPCSYIECGVAGELEGWEEGDDTGRTYTPGKVAHLNENGKTTFSAPQETEQKITTITEITWETFSEFVWCGQNYE